MSVELEKLYTIKDMRIAFERGFYSFEEVDKDYGNWKEAYEQGLEDTFFDFIKNYNE